MATLLDKKVRMQGLGGEVLTLTVDAGTAGGIDLEVEEKSGIASIVLSPDEARYLAETLRMLAMSCETWERERRR